MCFQGSYAVLRLSLGGLLWVLTCRAVVCIVCFRFEVFFVEGLDGTG